MNSYRSTSTISGNTSSAIMTDLSARTVIIIKKRFIHLIFILKYSRILEVKQV